MKLVCKFLCRTKWNIFLLQEKMYDFCVDQKCREKPNVKKKFVKKNSRKKLIHLQKKKSLLIKKVFSLVSHMKKIIMCGTSEKKFLCGSQWNFFFLCGTERKSFFIGSTKMSLKKKESVKTHSCEIFSFLLPWLKRGAKKKKNLWETREKKIYSGFPYFMVFDIYNSVCGFIQFYVDPQMLKYNALIPKVSFTLCCVTQMIFCWSHIG